MRAYFSVRSELFSGVGTRETNLVVAYQRRSPSNGDATSKPSRGRRFRKQSAHLIQGGLLRAEVENMIAVHDPESARGEHTHREAIQQAPEDVRFQRIVVQNMTLMRFVTRWLGLSLVLFIAFVESPAFAHSVVMTSSSTVFVSVGASETMSIRRDHDNEWFFVPKVSAYFWEANKYVQLGGGCDVHFWAVGEPEGGPLVTPSLGLRKIFLLDPQNVLGFRAITGGLIGHYNDEWHHGLAVTLGPDLEIYSNAYLFGGPLLWRFGVEATLFYTGEATRMDRYQPVLSLGATIGLAYPVFWTRKD
ncbi:MAG: hypothetical protein ABW133_11720 [Polyangiaceae bacterium]